MIEPRTEGCQSSILNIVFAALSQQVLVKKENYTEQGLKPAWNELGQPRDTHLTMVAYPSDNCVYPPGERGSCLEELGRFPVAVWFWLAGQADEPEEKRRCMDAMLEIDPENTRPLLALVALRSGRTDD